MISLFGMKLLSDNSGGLSSTVTFYKLYQHASISWHMHEFNLNSSKMILHTYLTFVDGPLCFVSFQKRSELF